MQVGPLNDLEDNTPIYEYYKPGKWIQQRSIALPAIPARAYELKTSWVNMVQRNQFSGTTAEDPSEHLDLFTEAVDMVRMENFPKEVLYLKLFPYTLIGRAREWLKEQPTGSITSWDELTEKFMEEFFPESKTTNIRNAIQSFKMNTDEQVHEAWARFKRLIRSCPHHNFPRWNLSAIFFSALPREMKRHLDAMVGGPFLKKSGAKDTFELLEELAWIFGQLNKTGTC